MYLSNEENLVIEGFLCRVRFNPLVEFVYVSRDSRCLNVITVCNFNDSKNFLNGTSKKETIKLITDSVSLYNIRNKENRIKFYSDDVANYYRPLDKKADGKNTGDLYFLDQERIPLNNSIMVLDKSESNVNSKKKVRNMHF